MSINKNGVSGVNLHCLVDEEIAALGLKYRSQVKGYRLQVTCYRSQKSNVCGFTVNRFIIIKLSTL